MSTYYMFYLAKKTDVGMTVIGPAIMIDSGEFKFKPAVVRSRSFINWEDWKEFMNYLPIGDINPNDKNIELLASDHSWNSEPDMKSDTYYCAYSTIAEKAANGGLHIGYAPLDDVNYVAQNDYHLEDKYYIEFLSTDVVAEMQPEDRKKYGKVAFFATNSVGYIANQLVDAFHELVSCSKDYYVVCVIG